MENRHINWKWLGISTGCKYSLLIWILYCWTETEAGSAEEQPARDRFSRRNVVWRAVSCSSPFFFKTIPEGVCLKKPLCCIGCRGLISKCLMLSIGVVFFKPLIGDLLSLVNWKEEVGIQDVFAVGSVEPLNDGVLLGRSFRNGTPLNCTTSKPRLEPLRHQFRAVIASYSFGLAVLFNEPIQKGCCFPSRNAKGIKYPIALSIIVVDYVEGPEPSTVNKGIGHEIYGPFLISHQGYYNGISGIVLHSFPWLLRKREPLPHIHASYLTRTQIWIHFLDLSNDLITSPSGWAYSRLYCFLHYQILCRHLFLVIQSAAGAVKYLTRLRNTYTTVLDYVVQALLLQRRR